MCYYTVLVFFFLAYFISNLMPPLIWQEVPVHGPEVGDPCCIPSIYFSYQKKFSQLQRQLPLPLAGNGDSLWSGVLLLQAQLPGDGSEVSLTCLYYQTHMVFLMVLWPLIAFFTNLTKSFSSTCEELTRFHTVLVSQSLDKGSINMFWVSKFCRNQTSWWMRTLPYFNFCFRFYPWRG